MVLFSKKNCFFFLSQKQRLPTAVTSAELAYDRTLSALGASLHGGIFAERNDDLTVPPFDGRYSVTQGAISRSASNIGHSDAAGLELSARGVLPRTLRWSAGYTYTGLVDHLQSGLPWAPTTRYAGGTPRNSVFFGLGASPGRWEMDLNIRWQSRYSSYAAYRFSDRQVGLGDFLTVSGRIAYRVLKPLSVALSADQLLRDRIMETPTIGVERRIILSATLHL